MRIARDLAALIAGIGGWLWWVIVMLHEFPLKPLCCFRIVGIVAAPARGADGGRVVHLTAPRFAMRCGSSWLSNHPQSVSLERQQHVHDLAAVTLLLEVTDLAVTAISDTGLRDLARIDGVVALDIFRPHDASDNQFALFVVDANLLPAFDHEIAVRKHLRDDGGDVGLQGFLPHNRAFAVGLRIAVGLKRAPRERLCGALAEQG